MPSLRREAFLFWVCIPYLRSYTVFLVYSRGLHKILIIHQKVICVWFWPRLFQAQEANKSRPLPQKRIQEWGMGTGLPHPNHNFSEYSITPRVITNKNEQFSDIFEWSLCMLKHYFCIKLCKKLSTNKNLLPPEGPPLKKRRIKGFQVYKKI